MNDGPARLPFWGTAHTTDASAHCCSSRRVFTSFAGLVDVSSTNFWGEIRPVFRPPVYSNDILVSTPGMPFGMNLNAPSLRWTSACRSNPSRTVSPFILGSCSRTPVGFPCGSSYRNGQWSEEKIVKVPLWRPLWAGKVRRRCERDIPIQIALVGGVRWWGW